MITSTSTNPVLRRSWLLLLITAVLLGGCHARSGCCHANNPCGSDAGDGIIAAFYVFYFLGWVIVSAAEG